MRWSAGSPVRRLLVGSVAGAAVVSGVAVGPVRAAEPLPREQHGSTRTAPDFLGIAATFSCSGALVRWPQSLPSDPALILTNGHCYRPSDKTDRSRGSASAVPRVERRVIVNRPDNRAIMLLRRNGSVRVTLHASLVLYSTSFRTDVGLYQLRRSFGQIKRRYGIPALTLSTSPPEADADVLIPSGYSKRVYTCTLNGFAYRLYDDMFDWRHSLRLVRSPTCRTIPGTSGSPVIDPRTRVVLGVNNAINLPPPGCAGGALCGRSNRAPDCRVSLCEKTKNGRVSLHPHRRYGQQTWWLTTCIGADRSLDLARPGCLLPKPRDRATSTSHAGLPATLTGSRARGVRPGI